MMKLKVKLLSIMIALSAGISQAGLVNVVSDSYTDNDSSGTITAGDVVHIKTISSVYVSVVDYGLAVTGPGTLSEAVGGLMASQSIIPVESI